MDRRDFIKKLALGGGLAGIISTIDLANPLIAEAGKRLSKEIIKRALSPGLDELTKKIIEIESNWRYWVHRKDTGAIGLMQIRKPVLREWNRYGEGRIYSKYDLFDPYVNVKVGKWYLHERIGDYYLPYYKLKKTEENKAASYHAGPVLIGKIGDAVENFNKLPRSTRKYLEKLWDLDV